MDHVATVVGQWQALRPDLDFTGMAVFGRIYRLARLLELRRNAVLEPYGLTLGDIDVLAPIWRHGGALRPRELRHTMLVGSGTLTARLDRLEADGLLERHSDPDDRRGRILRLTARGARLLPEVVEQLLEVENQVLVALPPEVRHRLAEDLARLLASTER